MKFKNEHSFWIFSAIVIVVGYLSLHDLMTMAETKSSFSFELLAAFLGSIITVAAMLVMIRLQARLEKETDYSKQLFEKKLEIYQDLVKVIFAMDDDNIITHNEIIVVENKIGSASLVAGEDVVSLLSQFMWQLKTYGVAYTYSMDTDQKKHFIDFVRKETDKENIDKSSLARSKYRQLKNSFNYTPSDEIIIKAAFVTLDDLIQSLRSDLDVVGGDIKEEISHFITVNLDHASLIRKPINLVSERRSSDQNQSTALESA